MRARLLISLLLGSILLATIGGAAAAKPGGFTGRWVARDVDESTWHITVSDSGQFHGHDSATIPGEGSRTRTWGDFTPVDELTMASDLNLQFMVPGPPQYLYLPGPFFFTYDPATDTIMADQGPAWDIAVFCRVPCDPDSFGPVPRP